MSDRIGCRDSAVGFSVGVLLILALACFLFAVSVSCEPQLWPTATPTPRPSRFNTPTPTRTKTPFPPTPTPWYASATPTPVASTPTPTTATGAHIHVEFCGAVGVTDILLNGSEPPSATWQRNKAMPVPIIKWKSGMWVETSTKQPVWSTLGDEVTVCAGAVCARALFPTPILAR